MQVELSGANLQPVHVTGDKPMLVTTYMVGQDAIPISPRQIVGDPSMSTAVPTEQFRSSYIFTAPTSYAINSASVIAKVGANAQIDGVVVADSAYTPIGSSGYGVAHVELSSDNSVHVLKADQEVGLIRVRLWALHELHVSRWRRSGPHHDPDHFPDPPGGRPAAHSERRKQNGLFKYES